jgi:hypothetical protein
MAKFRGNIRGRPGRILAPPPHPRYTMLDQQPQTATCTVDRMSGAGQVVRACCLAAPLGCSEHGDTGSPNILYNIKGRWGRCCPLVNAACPPTLTQHRMGRGVPNIVCTAPCATHPMRAPHPCCTPTPMLAGGRWVQGPPVGPAPPSQQGQSVGWAVDWPTRHCHAATPHPTLYTEHPTVYTE